MSFIYEITKDFFASFHSDKSRKLVFGCFLCVRVCVGDEKRNTASEMAIKTLKHFFIPALEWDEFYVNEIFLFTPTSYLLPRGFHPPNPLLSSIFTMFSPHCAYSHDGKGERR
jgi:hypothetical protein